MRISDWSSDVCSSDLAPVQVIPKRVLRDLAALAMHAVLDGLTLHELVACAIGGEERVERSGAGAGQPHGIRAETPPRRPMPIGMAGCVIRVQIGRASCRERVGQYV